MSLNIQLQSILFRDNHNLKEAESLIHGNNTQNQGWLPINPESGSFISHLFSLKNFKVMTVTVESWPSI